jgi:predicted nucleic acid-binding protein
LFEVERVLLYPRIQSRFDINSMESARLTQDLAGVSQLVEPVVTSPLIGQDPPDDYVLYTAAAGRSDVLCTGNVRHFAGLEVERFCVSRGIRVMSDVEALRDVRRQCPTTLLR